MKNYCAIYNKECAQPFCRYPISIIIIQIITRRFGICLIKNTVKPDAWCCPAAIVCYIVNVSIVNVCMYCKMYLAWRGDIS